MDECSSASIVSLCPKDVQRKKQAARESGDRQRPGAEIQRLHSSSGTFPPCDSARLLPHSSVAVPRCKFDPPVFVMEATMSWAESSKAEPREVGPHSVPSRLIIQHHLRDADVVYSAYKLTTNSRYSAKHYLRSAHF